MLLRLFLFFKDSFEKDLKFLEDRSIVLKVFYYFFIIFVVLFIFYFLFYIIPLFFFFFLNSYFLFEDCIFFLLVIVKKFENFFFFDYINNLKLDIDNTTNTDGEDLLSYLNDFTEISLQERGYFFDLILSHPFDFFLYSSFSYIFIKIITNNKIKTPGNLFKYINNFFFK